MAVTKTLGPLHFEDLEPKRFEDWVRELNYEFKDWQRTSCRGCAKRFRAPFDKSIGACAESTEHSRRTSSRAVGNMRDSVA
jgi:hypothetical protein